MQCFQTAAATFTPAYLAGTTATLPAATTMVYQVAYDGSVTMSGMHPIPSKYFYEVLSDNYYSETTSTGQLIGQAA